MDEYSKKTFAVVSLIKSNLEQKIFSYEKAYSIYDNFSRNKNPLYKIKLLFLTKEDIENKALNFFKKFSEGVFKFQDEILKLEEITKYFEEFFKNSKREEKFKTKELISSFKQSQIKDFEKIIETPDYLEIIKYFDDATFYNKLNEFHCFKNIRKDTISFIKDEINEGKIDDNLSLQNALEKFDQLKNIFENEKIESISDNIKYLLELALDEDKEKLNKEINFLKYHFKIKEDDDKINEIKSNIILFARTNKIIYVLLGLKELYNLFSDQITEEQDILTKIENYLEDLKDPKIEKKKIEEIISFLKEFNIYLVEEQSENKMIQENIKSRDIFFEFLKLIQNNNEPIVFAKSNMKINAKLLLDFLVESDYKKNLQENDVQGFIKTVEFFAKYKQQNFKYSEFIIFMNDALTIPGKENYLGEFINKYIKNFNGIKTLYNESLNKSESSSLEISSILRNSQVKITYKTMNIEYHNIDNVLTQLDFESIEELRGKALIMKSYMKKDKTKEKLIDTNYFNVRKFVDLIQNFKTLNNYLNDLYNIGLPEPENYIISIKIDSDHIRLSNNNEKYKYDYSDIICIMCGKEFKLKNLIEYLYLLKIEIQDQTEKCYLENEYIRFFYGKTFEFINRNLKSKDFNKLLSLFKSITNNRISKIIDNFDYNFDSLLTVSSISNFNYLKELDYFDLSEDNDEKLKDEIKTNEKNLENEIKENINEIKTHEENEKLEKLNNNFNFNFNQENIDPIIFSFMNMLYNISEYCKQVFQANEINSCEDIYKINEIKVTEEKEKYIGVNISTTSKQNNDKKLFIYYKELSNSSPNLSSLLICNEETTKEQIISFLFRVFLCPCQTLFIISKSDSLNKFNKIFLIEKVNEFLKIYKNNMKSLLIIFHSEENSEIKKGFNNIKEVKVFQCKFENEIHNKEYLDKVEKLKMITVVKSESCGEGKSTFIKTQGKNTRKKYIYFQIGGVFTRKTLFERIEDQIFLKNEKTQYILHIDLTYTELKDLVMEFLFKFLIMKYYDYDDKIFCYNPNQIEIYIEIHNEIYNIVNYQILKFCELHPMKLSPLIEEEISPEKKDKKRVGDSKIQIVAQIFKKLYDKNIGLKNINLNSTELLPPNKVKEKGNDDKSFSSCQELIDYYFYLNSDQDLEIKNPNYYQKKMFINLLADQFTRFTKSIFFRPDLLIENLSFNYKNDKLGKQKTVQIRELIIYSLLNNTKLLVKGPYENLIKEQEQTDIFMKSEEEQNRDEINKLANDKLKTMITYDNIKQSIIAFDDNKSSYMFKIVPSSCCGEEEFKKLNDLFNTQIFENEKTKKKQLKKPKLKSETELLNDILDLCGVENDIEKERSRIEIKNKFPTYVFTTDNYTKMIHILMKTRANVPIIMMGETGCGKTSLIKMLSLIKNKGKKIRMKILNIHQGIDNDEIIYFLKKVMIETKREDDNLILNKKEEFSIIFEEQEKQKKEQEQKKAEEKKLEPKKKDKKEKEQKNKDQKQDEKKKQEDEIKKKEERKKKRFEEIEKEVKESQMWIFFDEINTCNSMGLISEIFCNKTYRGNPIPDRFIFIGACNPYRILSDKNNNIEFGLNLKNKKQKNLVYTVNPLPHSLLNYVIDFGELSEKDTKLYIQSMLKKKIEEPKLLSIAVETVEKCHMFIKEKSDTSSVSLRDIKYFNIFYEGFIKYYEYLKELSKKQNPGFAKKDEHLEEIKPMGYDSFKKNAINLSIYICYYLRLPTKELRKELGEKIDMFNFFDYEFLHIPLKESKYIINQLDIAPEKGIAKNNALRENIFCELFCLVNKVPLIICGKPGNSKTLSVQLLLDNLKGKSSLNDFFKNPDYKEVMPYPFQGSTTCTSKGVLKTFDKARKFSEKNKEMMSLVFFDEMGLAEESIENPLKYCILN